MEESIAERDSTAPADRSAPRLRSAAAWLIVYLLLGIASTWPLVRHLNEATSDPGDPLLLAWSLHYDYVKTFSAPLDLFNAPLFYPSKLALGFSEHIYGIALLCFPLFALGLPVLVVYNLAVLGGFVTSGMGAHFLARVCGASRIGSFAAGAFFMLLPFRFMHLSHLQHLWSVWIPVMLGLLILWFRAPRMRYAVLFAIAFLLNGLSNIHYLLFGGFTVALTGVVLQAWHRRSIRQLLPLVIATGVASLAMLPFLTPYQEVKRLYGMVRGIEEVGYFSATWIDWLRPVWSSSIWGETKLALEGKAERSLFPGLVVFLLTIGVLLPPREQQTKRLRFLDVLILLGSIATALGVINDGLRWEYAECRFFGWRGYSTPMMVTIVTLMVRLWIRFPWARDDDATPASSLRTRIEQSALPPMFWLALLWIAIGAIGSLGLNGFLHDFLYGRVEAFKALRVPARWAIIAYTGLSVTAAFGLDAWLRHARRRALTAVVLLGLLAFETRVAPIRWYLVDARPQAVHRWIAAIPGKTPLIEFPFNDGWSEYAAMLASTVHQKPFVNGISGFEPPFHYTISMLQNANRMSEVTDLLTRARVPLIVVHDDQLGLQRTRVRQWLNAEMSRGRVQILARFEEGIGGAWVFGITSLLPADYERTFRVASAATRQTLSDAFASDLPLLQSNTFGFVDQPASGAELQGRFVISGWALSSNGVKTVRAHFNNRANTVELPMSPYPALHRRFTHYAPSSNEAFAIWLDRIPGHDEGWTDLEIEAEDLKGRRTRLFYGMVSWKKDRRICDNEWEEPQLRNLLARLGAPASRFNEVENGAPLTPELKQFLRTNESRSDEWFVTETQRVLLGRPPAPEDMKRDALRITRGFPRADYVREIFNSLQFGEKHIRVRATYKGPS